MAFGVGGWVLLFFKPPQLAGGQRAAPGKRINFVQAVYVESMGPGAALQACAARCSSPGKVSGLEHTLPSAVKYGVGADVVDTLTAGTPL